MYVVANEIFLWRATTFLRLEINRLIAHVRNEVGECFLQHVDIAASKKTWTSKKTHSFWFENGSVSPYVTPDHKMMVTIYHAEKHSTTF